jgi:hypothetical protein
MEFFIDTLKVSHCLYHQIHSAFVGRWSKEKKKRQAVFVKTVQNPSQMF